MTETTPRKDQTTPPEAGVAESRREALAKMGRFAGYTAPAMLVLLGATKVRAHGRGSEVRPKKYGHYSGKKKKYGEKKKKKILYSLRSLLKRFFS
jgi:hypothetical protein